MVRRLDHQQAVAAQGAQVAGQVDPALAAPGDEQLVDLQHVVAGELGGGYAGREGRAVEGAVAQGRRLGGEGLDVEAARPPGGLERARGEVVEQGGVVAQLVGGAGQRLARPRGRARPPAPAAPGAAPGRG